MSVTSARVVILSQSEADTTRMSLTLAEHLRSHLEHVNPEERFHILLKGELGAGKTCFARAFLRSWLRQPELIVQSPTYAIARDYHHERVSALHVDAYRLESEDDLYALGVDEMFFQPRCAALVEWPDAVRSLLDPEHEVQVTIQDLGPGRREIHIESPRADFIPKVTQT